MVNDVKINRMKKKRRKRDGGSEGDGKRLERAGRSNRRKRQILNFASTEIGGGLNPKLARALPTPTRRAHGAPTRKVVH